MPPARVTSRPAFAPLLLLSRLIGAKGIGFKAVFRVSDAPEVHSAGYHITFDLAQVSQNRASNEAINRSMSRTTESINKSMKLDHTGSGVRWCSRACFDAAAPGPAAGPRCFPRVCTLLGCRCASQPLLSHALLSLSSHMCSLLPSTPLFRLCRAERRAGLHSPRLDPRRGAGRSGGPRQPAGARPRCLHRHRPALQRGTAGHVCWLAWVAREGSRACRMKTDRSACVAGAAAPGLFPGSAHRAPLLRLPPPLQTLRGRGGGGGSLRRRFEDLHTSLLLFLQARTACTTCTACMYCLYSQHPLRVQPACTVGAAPRERASAAQWGPHYRSMRLTAAASRRSTLLRRAHRRGTRPCPMSFPWCRSCIAQW